VTRDDLTGGGSYASTMKRALAVALTAIIVAGCSGGDEIATRWHSVEQGPCGFTDDWFSPDDEPFVIEATATWTVTDNTSDGRNGTSTPIARTDSLEYAVGEIQTVGESG
jgi:hypothetical protein